jgi:hypothetical protein
MAPAVGYQITFDGTNNGSAVLAARMDRLEAQASLSNCELIAKGRVGSTQRGWHYQGGGAWESDIAAEASIARAQLIAYAGAGHELTVTGVPAGCGRASASTATAMAGVTRTS